MGGMLPTMFQTFLKVSVALGLLLASGCGVSNPHAGTYQEDMSGIRARIMKGVKEGEEPNSMQKNLLTRLENYSCTLELKPDGTCLMTTKEGATLNKDPGKWRIEGDKLILDGHDRLTKKPHSVTLDYKDGVARMMVDQGDDSERVFRKVTKN